MDYKIETKCSRTLYGSTKTAASQPNRTQDFSFFFFLRFFLQAPARTRLLSNKYPVDCWSKSSTIQKNSPLFAIRTGLDFIFKSRKSNLKPTPEQPARQKEILLLKFHQPSTLSSNCWIVQRCYQTSKEHVLPAIWLHTSDSWKTEYRW